VDRRYDCGQLNRIETFLSALALAADHLRRGGNLLTAKEIAARARAGDEAAQASVRRHAERIA
jgi:fructokinase